MFKHKDKKYIYTVRVLLPNGSIRYLYFGSALNNSPRYTSSRSDKKEVSFYNMNYTKQYLNEGEITRLQRIDPDIDATIVMLELDKDHKFVRELGKKEQLHIEELENPKTK